MHVIRTRGKHRLSARVERVGAQPPAALARGDDRRAIVGDASGRVHGVRAVLGGDVALVRDALVAGRAAVGVAALGVALERDLVAGVGGVREGDAVLLLDHVSVHDRRVGVVGASIDLNAADVYRGHDIVRKRLERVFDGLAAVSDGVEVGVRASRHGKDTHLHAVVLVLEVDVSDAYVESRRARVCIARLGDLDILDGTVLLKQGLHLGGRQLVTVVSCHGAGKDTRDGELGRSEVAARGRSIGRSTELFTCERSAHVLERATSRARHAQVVLEVPPDGDGHGRPRLAVRVRVREGHFSRELLVGREGDLLDLVRLRARGHSLALDLRGEGIVAARALAERAVRASVVSVADARARHAAVDAGAGALAVPRAVVRARGAPAVVARVALRAGAGPARGVADTAPGAHLVAVAGERRARGADFLGAVGARPHGVARAAVVGTAASVAAAAVRARGAHGRDGRSGEDRQEHRFVNARHHGVSRVVR
mmetsp:Transcript_173569/g.422148  ORF Transcript_173569/g.422148 Transcript_173569/m.422148 type:complete len:484 (-) Transcript_173569:63-1514(-)